MKKLLLLTMFSLFPFGGQSIYSASWKHKNNPERDYVPEYESFPTFDKAQVEKLRNQLKKMLGIPSVRCDLAPEFRGSFEHDGILVEKWIWTSEPGSKVTSLLYRPLKPKGLMPGMVITNGHGGSKNSAYNIYTAQLYAKSGIATLLHDTLGEEERHIHGGMGTRAHDTEEADQRAADAGRLMMGKMVFDALRGVDFLLERKDVDPHRIAVAGNSMGGTKATWLLALEPRLKAVIVSGWGFGAYNAESGKRCSRIPAQLREQMTNWPEYLGLAAPNASVLVMNGLQDEVIDQNRSGTIWQQTKNNVSATAGTYSKHGNVIEAWFDPQGGHRAYHHHKDALIWLNQHFSTPALTKQEIEDLPEITLEKWYQKHNLIYQGSEMYWVERHHRGAVYVDLDIRPISSEKLKVLEPHEIGLPEFTLEGWLDLIGN
jgi:dienelactone hydrolase